MAGYTKLFGSILQSTVWLMSSDARIVWIAMLALADRDGVVGASVPGLAKTAGVSREACEEALACFLAPDPDSRTKDFEGRRIEVVDGGWRLLNYDTYRQRASLDEVREKNRERQRRWAARKKGVTTVARNVTASPNVSLTPNNESNDIASASPSAKAEEGGDPEPLDPYWNPRTANGLLKMFGNLWERANKRMWTGHPMAARAAATFMDRTADELTALAPMLRPAVERFLADDRDYYVKRGHPFESFAKDFDRHAGESHGSSGVDDWAAAKG